MIPNTHVLVDGECNAPIPGSVSISPATSAFASPLSAVCRPEITVKLVRLVSSRRPSPSSPGNETGNKTLPWRRRTAQVQPLRSHTPNAQSQTLAECIIWHNPDVTSLDLQERKFSFSLPIPGNIPPTADTVLGTVSYTIAATVRFASSVSVQDSLPIKIRRAAPLEPVWHTRAYPGSPVVTELCIAPCPAETKRTGHQAQYDIEWQAKSTILDGERESEVKYVVAEEVRWQVDEIVKCLSLARQENRTNRRKIVSSQEHTRQICQGAIAGRWLAGSGRKDQPEEAGAGGRIEIPFQVRIPTAVDEIDALAYFGDPECAHGEEMDEMETLAITVSHRLHLEVVTGEDTFHRETGDLVERRRRVRSYKADFALPVREVVDIDFLNQLRAATGLPMYGDPHPALPEYSGE
ncbi:uncharacterized protein BDW70DRAFT_156722 [Aspergillus foveolatus]|uniref:uncharacterized protein n=1 Tax=Aspergillus foveolatus TaxID=210207 RepID=UPI003CCCE269